MKKVTKYIVSKRIIILAILSALTYLATSHFGISLWYILLFGMVTGAIFGKVFCRWVCPMGFIMELLMGRNSQHSSMYQYHKVGCPIAWVTGLLNKRSLFKIKINQETCLHCGKCDQECYISTLEPTSFSLYKPDKLKSGDSYSCSKCLKCVAACPNGSLKYKI
jgi:polyferredoxin